MTLLSIIRGFKGTLTGLTVAGALFYNGYLGLENHLSNFDERASRAIVLKDQILPDVPVEPEKIDEYRKKLTEYEQLINNPEVMKKVNESRRDINRCVGSTTLGIISLLCCYGIFDFDKYRRRRN